MYNNIPYLLQVIATELLRNLGLALICVSITTLVLIATISSSAMVILCVIITLVRAQIFDNLVYVVIAAIFLGRCLWSNAFLGNDN